MITLLEVLAMVTLAGLGAIFFRRRIRRGSALALVFAGFCAVLAMPQAAAASEYRKGHSVEVREGETIKGDIFLFGDRVRIEGTVDGDVYAFSQDVTVNGHVRGDVIAFAHTLRIGGKVEGNIRAGVNTLTVTGSVDKNALIFADYANLDSSGKIGGSITAFAESLNLDGKLGRDILIYSKHLGVTGTVGGGIQAKGSTMSISATGEVSGPVRFEGENAPEISSGAKLASPVDFKRLEHRHDYRQGSYYVWQVIWAAAYILFGLVLFALMPQFSQDAVKSAEQYGASAGLGVLVGFGLPIAAVIACFTVVGLFIGLSTLFLWYGSLYFGGVIVGAVVGQWLMGRTSEVWPLIGRMAVGFVVLRLCTMIPHVGWLIKYGAAFWGIGAISLVVYRRLQPRVAPNVPSAPFTPPLPPNTTVGGTMPA